MNATSAELTAAAAECVSREIESFDRCDTDGFVSQWANGVMARKYQMMAELEDRGGVADFEILCDLDGNKIPARQISTRFGTRWAVWASFESMESRGEIIAWLSISASDKSLAKKGYARGYESLPARVILVGFNACSVYPIFVPANDPRK